MFKDLIKEIQKLEKTQTIAIPIGSDKDGYVDKECPSQECLFQFKVHEKDWRDLFKDEQVFCPQCGTDAPSKSWWTSEQIEEAKEKAFEQIKGRIGLALDRGAKQFNSKPQSGFITMKMKYSGFKSSSFILPISAKDVMEQKIECVDCHARYSVVGSSFFCPCCGLNSVDRMFESSMDKVRYKLNNVSKIKKMLEDSGQKDEAAVTSTSLIESALSDCVTAFQRFNEKTYQSLSSKPVQANAFQRLDFANKAWKELCGSGINEWISENEFMEMNIQFQRRHILQHAEGIVDQKYLDRSNDSFYKLGQRIVIKAEDVQNLVNTIQKVAARIRLANVKDASGE